MDKETLERIKENPELLVRFVAKNDLSVFSRYIKPKMDMSNFHKVYYKVLDLFAHKKIKKLIISMPPQHGKLIADNQLVMTPFGVKRHGELRVGDYVFGSDGQPVKVLWVSPKDYADVLVTFSDGQQIKCHKRHEWVVYDRSRHCKRTIETQELMNSKLYNGVLGKRGCHYRFRVDENKVVSFDEREVAIDAYTLGAWLGDGKKNEPVIYIGCDDVEIINNIPYKHNEQKGTTTRVFYFPALLPLLRKYDLMNNKHIPKDYIFNSVEVRKAIIAGLIDTDGYVYQKTGRVTISNTNLGIIEDAAFILRSLGMRATVSKAEASTSSSGIVGKLDCYQLTFNPNTTFPTVVPRKSINKTNFLVRKRSIVSIEPTNPEIGNCIEVEGGIYLVGDHFVPTHNSEGSTRFLPAFLLGMNPDLKIVVCSYNMEQARSFNRDVQRIIGSDAYKAVFPDTKLSDGKIKMGNVYQCNADVSEPIGHTGYLRAVGRSGPLTGKTVDVLILDDIYKDYNEANSPIVREMAWHWYTSVCRTRLHNDSQEIIVFTRWHKEDVVGRLEDSTERIVDVNSWEDLSKVRKLDWVRINFPALKMGEPTELDPRKEGEALWGDRHSKEKLLTVRELDPTQFMCLYQGLPSNAEGRLYGEFKTYSEKSEYGTFVRRGCMVDVADKGKDYLCAICYDIYRSPNTAFNEQTKKFEPILFALVTDVLYTQEGSEITSVTLPQMINANGSQKVWIECNAGGQIFAQNVAKRVRAQVATFFTSANKESRVIGNAGFVNSSIVFPLGWEFKWEKFAKDVTEFLRFWGANVHDDSVDTLTGICEKELMSNNYLPYSHTKRGISRRN